jgi:hypothetical protein
MARTAISMKLPDMDLQTTGKPIRRRFSPRTPIGQKSDTWINVEHTVDPAKALMKRIGKIPEGIVQFSNILVAIYQPPSVEKTSGGVFVAQTLQKEDVDEYLWQGKVGLIVAMGPQAYMDDDNVKFHGTKNKVGDWVWFQPSNGQACDVNEVFCRVFETERFIRGVIPHPDYII